MGNGSNGGGCLEESTGTNNDWFWALTKTKIMEGDIMYQNYLIYNINILFTFSSNNQKKLKLSVESLLLKNFYNIPENKCVR